MALKFRVHIKLKDWLKYIFINNDFTVYELQYRG